MMIMMKMLVMMLIMMGTVIARMRELVLMYRRQTDQLGVRGAALA